MRYVSRSIGISEKILVWEIWVPAQLTINWSESESVSRSVVSNSVRPHGMWPAKLFCPWDSPGKNTEVGSHSLLQGLFLTQGLKLGLTLIAGRLFTV